MGEQQTESCDYRNDRKFICQHIVKMQALAPLVLTLIISIARKPK